MLSASSYGCSKVIGISFLRLFFDSGKRIYAKNYQIEDRLGYPEVLSASSYGCSKVGASYTLGGTPKLLVSVVVSFTLGNLITVPL